MLAMAKSSVSLNANNKDGYDLLLLEPNLELLSAEGLGGKSVGVLPTFISSLRTIFQAQLCSHIS